MQNSTIPEVADLTADWFTATLRSGGTISDDRSVTEVSLERLGTEESMMSLLFRAHLSYDTPAAGPERLVVKLASESDRMRGVAQLFGFYRREVLFYHQFSANAVARMPQCYRAEMHPEEPFFVVVMDDIGGGRAVDQLDGLNLADTKQALDAIADFQAPNWGTDLMPYAETFLPFDCEPLHMVIPANVENEWGIAKPKLNGELAPEVVDLLDNFGAICSEVLRAMNGPDTLIHGDYRADNLSFDGDGMLMFDFQLASIANGAVDVAYLVSQSVDEAVVAEHGDALLQHYLDRLATHGITMTFDEARPAYEAALLFFLQIPMSLLVGEGMPERADALGRTMLRRASAEILRTGAHKRFGQ
jgi:hypothetical protein